MGRSLPAWLKKRVCWSENWLETREILKNLQLHTVCESAHCPNLGECYADSTATFMILGNVCSRKCTFCAVKKGIPLPVDEQEPQRVAEAARRLGLKYIVVTSVTRDDLPDGGAKHFALTVRAIRHLLPGAAVEILTPDFQGNQEAIFWISKFPPEVFNHNLETVPRLYPAVRPGADYFRSLNLLAEVKKKMPGLYTKSGLMLGLGEKEEEVISVMEDLRTSECDFLTLGQYLSPSSHHYPVLEFIEPEQFENYRRKALSLGFIGVAAGPFVRSSFRAAKLFPAKRIEKLYWDIITQK